MKAISLYQPWASAIAFGLKRWETRSWATKHTGPIAIHAVKTDNWKLRSEFLSLCLAYREIRTAFGDNLAANIQWERLPFGSVICTAQLVVCLPVEKCVPSEIERALGDYSPGRFIWELKNVKVLTDPIPFKGRQGLFEVPDELLAGASYVEPKERR